MELSIEPTLAARFSMKLVWELDHLAAKRNEETVAWFRIYDGSSGEAAEAREDQRVIAEKETRNPE